MKQTVLLLCALLLIASPVAALEADELAIFGVEAEKLLNLASCAVALALAGLTVAAYKKKRKQRFLLIAAAFGLFALKSFLVGAEIFFGEWLLVDPLASVLDFAILAAFFLGVLRRE